MELPQSNQGAIDQTNNQARGQLAASGAIISMTPSRVDEHLAKDLFPGT